MNMHQIPEQTPTAGQLRPQNNKAAPVAKASWKPQPGGLTREELRKIVLDALG
ncbi:hypothetical protein [uncultured Methylobacterium sp.]|nr:hypothetical protein [uncultured Methylobacterium sp.]